MLLPELSERANEILGGGSRKRDEKKPLRVKPLLQEACHPQEERVVLPVPGPASARRESAVDSANSSCGFGSAIAIPTYTPAEAGATIELKLGRRSSCRPPRRSGRAAGQLNPQHGSSRTETTRHGGPDPRLMRRTRNRRGRNSESGGAAGVGPVPNPPERRPRCASGDKVVVTMSCPCRSPVPRRTRSMIQAASHRPNRRGRLPSPSRG